MESFNVTSDFHAFKIKNMWGYFKSQHFSFWMICGYLFFEFVKPQALFPVIDVLPWAQLLLIGALIGAFLDSSVKWVHSKANLYITIFSIIIIISMVTARYPEVSQQNFIHLFGWVAIYFLTINIVNTSKRFYIFLMIYLIAAGKIAIGTAKTWAGRGFEFTNWGLMGPSGYFQNSGELAVLMSMLFPLAFYMYRYLKNKISLWERILLAAFWICPIFTILGASSRGAQVALVIQLIFMFRKSLFRIKPLIGVIILFTSIYFLMPEEQKDRFKNVGYDKTSEQRLLYWKNGWEMMKEHPLTGVGYFNFIPYYEAYYSHDMLYPQAQLPHNIFIQVGTDGGFPALIFFIAIISFCLLTPLKKIKERRELDFENAIYAGLGIGVLGFVIAGQFVTISYYPFIWIHAAFIACMLNITRSGKVANN